MASCFKQSVLRRGLKMVFMCSACMFTGLLSGFILASQWIITVVPGLTGIGLAVALGFSILPVAAYILHVIVDSVLALRNPSYFTERGLEVCA
ncbi:hypothetical protein IMZ38_03890 [Thermosphaera chiliense]|uniref:Uncharacterized protein n=1 Tax=Thermosphaera chiliense TaxID=3402707 RepID=A0A7M1US04_9CREN|nr:hypothetical protein [Thermosphaera aggregans]QOR93802.1 hypothetical protein IMZ38_03890 [Thermosphaera aggregans]